MVKIEGITHWSIPVNDLEESEKFYQDVLGCEYKGRLGGATMSCVMVGEQPVLLCQRPEPITNGRERDGSAHHSFTVSPASFEEGARTFKQKSVPVVELVYREKGFFTGRELYFLDPSGNRLELRDPTWRPGMPKPSYEELAGA
jgi:catechol 2,3-dioxygenase-like lactoylglutathione lyase family enzyme